MQRTTVSLVAIIFACPAWAQNCDVVINQRAFNASDKRSVAEVYNRARSDMCHEQWSDQGSFNQAANSLGISFEYASYAFGLNSSNSSSGSSYARAREI